METINWGRKNYSINKNGDVINNNTDKILKQQIDRYGYYTISLCNTRKCKKKFLISRLLGLAFIPNPDNLPTIDHINRIKTDNRIENLQWATHKEQRANQGVYPTRKDNVLKQKCIRSMGKNYQVRIRSRNICKTFKTLDEAIKFRDSAMG